MPDNTREEQINRITELSIQTGEKFAKTKVLHLTSNQGGMPHPDLYRANMKKLALRKIDKLIQSEITKAVNEYHNEITDNERKVWLYKDDLGKRSTKAQEQLLDELEAKALKESGGNRFADTEDGRLAATAWDDAQSKIYRFIEAKRKEIRGER